MVKKILVTGGAGYIGTSLVPKLLRAGHEVTVFDNLMVGGNQLLPFFRYENFKFVRGDIRHKEELKKVFKPFAKVKGDLSGSEGLGLGLSFVDAITTKMKGEIKVISALNEGTHFLVKLPNISVIELEKEDEIESVQPFSQEVVCIIEENKYTMEKVKETLEELNLNVLTFTNLEAFSGYINFSKADLILVQRDLTSLGQFVNFKMFLCIIWHGL